MARTEALDNGLADVLVLRDSDAQLQTDAVTVAGGARADVFAEGDQTLVQVAAGHPTSLELLRGVLTSPDLRIVGEVLDVVIVSHGGYDRYVLSGDLEHRWLFTRHWDRRPEQAPTMALVGHSPFDRETSAATTGSRGSLAQAFDLLSAAVGTPRTLHAVNVFTRRVRSNADITGAPADRRADPGVVAAALDEADAVLAAWGAVPEPGLDAVADTVELLRACRDAGTRVLLRSHGGTFETSGTPPQPLAGHVVRPGTRLVDAPAEWLWGGVLVT